MKSNQDTIQERFGGISDKDFWFQYLQAQELIARAASRPVEDTIYLANTDLQTNKDWENGTYNLFMTLVTSGGAYNYETDGEEVLGVWLADKENILDGLMETANDKRKQCQYHAEEASYLLERIDGLVDKNNQGFKKY